MTFTAQPYGLNFITHTQTYPIELKRIKDNVGMLYLVDCPLTGYFEEYGIKKVKEIIREKYKLSTK